RRAPDVAVAPAHLRAPRRPGRASCAPARARGGGPARAERVEVADDDAVARGLDPDHVAAAVARDAEPAALAHREAVDPAVAPEHAARGVDDLALAGEALGAQHLDGGGGVAVGDEAELLALGLLGGRGAEPGRGRAHPPPAELAEREARGSELFGPELVEEVALVLRGVARAQEPPRAGFGVGLHARVVAGRDRRGAEDARAREEVVELEARVAGDAGDGRLAREVGVG